MESIRRLGRPSNVFRAVGKWRGRSAHAMPGGAPVLASASGSDVPLYEAFPHLAAAGAAPDQAPAGAPVPPPEPPEGPDSPEDRPEPAPRKRHLKLWLYGILLVLAAMLAAWTVLEVRTSRLQAKIFAEIADDLNFRMEKGVSPSIRFPGASPYDTRLGYANIPAYLQKLESRGYLVEAQARISPKMVEMDDRGLYATYHEKTKVGLEILDCRAQPLFASRFPERFYHKFDDAPSLLVQSLLFIENRELLDNGLSEAQSGGGVGPPVSKAVLEKTVSSVGLGGAVARAAGGSTLGHANREIPPFAGRADRLA